MENLVQSPPMCQILDTCLHAIRILDEVVCLVCSKDENGLTDKRAWLIWIGELSDMGAGQYGYWLSPIQFNYKMLGESLAVEKYRVK